MGWRIAAVLTVCTLLPVVGGWVLAGRDASALAQQTTQARLQTLSRTSAAELGARLNTAGLAVRALTSQPEITDAQLLSQARATGAFTAVHLSTPAGADPPVRLLPAQEQALAAGRTLLALAPGAGRPALFLLRALPGAHGPRVAFFALAEAWLWQDIESPRSGVMLALVDTQGRVLESPVSLPDEVVRMFARHIELERVPDGAHALGWQANRYEWQGMVSRLTLSSAEVASPWGVVAFMQAPQIPAALPPLREALLGVLLALAVALLGALYLAGCYVPALRRAREGLLAMRERRSEPLAVQGRDEVRMLIESVNYCAVSVQDQLGTLETLAEIDQLLLGSAGLEQVLDAVLRRAQRVTHGHCVGIALRDADAPGHGRVYLAAGEVRDLPVSRVVLDEGLLATLASETRGLTVARCEEVRHSFLKPLKDAGAEFFWVWPVRVGERVEAMLAVGYGELPSADPQVLRCGEEFAGRLGVALSKRARDEQLYRQAHYDPLTALPNRLLFRDRLSRELAIAVTGAARGALLYIDLDHFKKVNDSVGHSAGDELLTVVAQRLRACVKDGDTVARLGGDEFAIVLRDVPDGEAARAVAERIHASLQLPVHLNGRDHHVFASVGITLFPDDGAAIEELLRNADTAMYRAKELGRSRSMCFDRSMSPQLETTSDSGLQRALRRREFSLYYQPQFAISDGALVGAEALLRWQTPRDGVRQPGEFVPAAEESGLIVDIGGWVLETACAQLAQWREQGVAPLRLSINVAHQQLRDGDLPATVRRALDKYALPGHLIELEVAQSVFNDAQAAAALGRLASAGVRLALVDFGLGYSSLSCLRQNPIGMVKIDRAFVAEVPLNPTAATLVETMIVTAQALGKGVVAEGIESLEQLDFLRERRCDVAQGFYLAKPLAAVALTELLMARGGTFAESAQTRAAS